MALVAGLAVALPVAAFTRWWLLPLLAWDFACIAYATWVWVTIWSCDAASTARLAVQVDPTRATADALVQAAAIASLAALGVVSVGFSWIVVHTVYTLRYARMYYTPPEGGVDFGGPEPPRFSDFAYLAFTLGMTFQVSDTNLQTNAFRKLALGHTLLSYLFGTVIVASTVNFIVSLG